MNVIVLLLLTQKRPNYFGDNTALFLREIMVQVLPDCPQTVLRHTICDISVDDCDITRTMRQMNSNSAPGPDGFHPKFMNNIYPFLIKPLKRIFNLSLSIGVVPISWKFSEVIPIYKNYRNEEAKQLCFIPPCLSNELYK